MVLSLCRSLDLLSLRIRRRDASASALVAPGVELLHAALGDRFVSPGVSASDTVSEGVDVAADGFACALRGVRSVGV